MSYIVTVAMDDSMNDQEWLHHEEYTIPDAERDDAVRISLEKFMYQHDLSLYDLAIGRFTIRAAKAP